MLSLVLQFISLESSTTQERYSTLSTVFIIYLFIYFSCFSWIELPQYASSITKNDRKRYC